MSNDTRFWAFRILNFALFFIEGSVLTKAIMGGFTTKSNAHHSTVWFIVFGVLCLVNVPVYLLYRRAKVNRWQASSAKSATQLEVETLAAFAAQQQAEKEAAAAKKPPAASTPPGTPTPPASTSATESKVRQ